jgi:predicted nucleic acid-binding protein
VASLIDSSVLIEVERGRLDLAPFARARAAMAAITAAELLAGVAGLRPSYRKDRSAAQVEAMIEAIPIVPFDLPCARTFARIGADLRSRGITVATNDLMIAATALTRGMTVVTRDRRSFPRIPGLEVDLLD